MRPHAKPVRKCHACPLNLGDHCWRYARPRDQWRGGKRCPGLDNADLLAEYRAWLKLPTVKTRKQLRQESSAGRRRAGILAERRPKRMDRG